eukprot:s207_g10.t2
MARVAHEPPACGPTNGTEDCGDVESVVDPGSPTRPSEIQSNHEPPSLASPVGLFGKFGVGMKGKTKSKSRLLLRTSTREVLSYRTLTLAESAYENAFLMRLITKSTLGKAHLLLLVNFFLQYSVVYLLSERTTGNQSLIKTKLFGQSNAIDATGICWQRDGDNRISCTPDEVALSVDFAVLDRDGDGRWTFAEAEALSNIHQATTGRYVNMTEFYKNVFRTLQQYAGPRHTECTLNDNIQAFDRDRGFWSDAFIGNITSDGHVVVNYVDAAKQASWARYMPNERLRKQLNGSIYSCNVPKCVDMDNGATDSSELACAGYNGFDACAGQWDDDDFHVKQLCCTCGGGSYSLTLAGLGHLPVNLPLDDFTNVRDFRICMQSAVQEEQQEDCIIKYTSIPRHVYDAEIATFANFCLIPESDLCGNLHDQQLLPRWTFEISSSVPMFMKIAGLSSTASLGQLNVCEKAIQTFCRRIYTVQATLFLEQRLDVCGKKSSQITRNKKIVSYAASETYSDPTFGLTSLLFQGFLFLIVFLWGLASVTEFRNILVWWNIVSSLPKEDAEDCLLYQLPEDAEDEAEATLEVVGLTTQHRVSTVLLNLLPRSALQGCIFIVGIRYLLSVRNVSDLILNSLALTFLVTVDEMLFAAFAGEQNAAWIQNCKPLRGRSFWWFDWILRKTAIPVGLLIFIPILATLGYFVIANKLLTDQLAHATYCLCDMSGDVCHARQILAALAQS